jgi:predicted nucleic acid-binding protein
VTILDACVLINLVNCNALDIVLKLPGHEFAAGPQVREECGKQRQVLDLAFQNALHLIDDSDISASLYLKFLADYELGFGETECLAIAFTQGANVCTTTRELVGCVKGYSGVIASSEVCGS